MGEKSRIKYEKVRAVISAGLCLMAACAAAWMLMAAALAAGLGSNRLFLACMGDIEYYRELSESMTENMGKHLAQFGLPSELSEGILDETEVYTEGTAYVASVLEGEEASIDSSGIKKRLQKNINEYLADYDLPDKKTVNQQIKTLLLNAAEDYEKSLSFSAAERYKEQRAEFLATVRRMLPYCAACFVVCAVVLLLMYHRKYHAVRWLNDAVLGGSIAAAAFNFYVCRRLLSMEILEGTGCYGQVMRNFFSQSCKRSWIIIISGLCLWLVLLLIINKMREEKI